MSIYRMSCNVNKYCSYSYATRKDEAILSAMYDGHSVIAHWSTMSAQRIPGIACDIMSSPDLYARLAVDEHAREVLTPYLAHAELLPFSFKSHTFWSIYLPTATDCLDYARTSFRLPKPDPKLIRRAAFLPDKLPKDREIFRVPGCQDYFVTETFKRAVEEAGLTGATFEPMFPLDGDDPVEEAATLPTTTAATTEPLPNPHRRQRPSRLEAVLYRLWDEVIDTAYDEIIEDPHAAGGFQVIADANLLGKAALERKLEPAELRRLIRSVAYSVTFSTLVTIEDEGVVTQSKFCGLHEGLLMASPELLE